MKDWKKTGKRVVKEKGSQSAELVVVLEAQGDGQGELIGVRRPSELAKLGLIGLGNVRVVDIRLTGRGAFKVRREGRNLKGTVQEIRCLRSGWT
jgi:hypothetical protein